MGIYGCISVRDHDHVRMCIYVLRARTCTQRAYAFVYVNMRVVCAGAHPCVLHVGTSVLGCGARPYFCACVRACACVCLSVHGHVYDIVEMYMCVACVQCTLVYAQCGIYRNF